MDLAGIGRYGSLRLLSSKKPGEYVASYPIDDEELTFGRSPECGVRMYYPSVSMVHCKIVFKERKVCGLSFSSFPCLMIIRRPSCTSSV